MVARPANRRRCYRSLHVCVATLVSSLPVLLYLYHLATEKDAMEHAYRAVMIGVESLLHVHVALIRVLCKTFIVGSRDGMGVGMGDPRLNTSAHSRANFALHLRIPVRQHQYASAWKSNCPTCEAVA